MPRIFGGKLEDNIAVLVIKRFDWHPKLAPKNTCWDYQILKQPGAYDDIRNSARISILGLRNMDKHEFLCRWETYSGLRLIGKERDRFLKECDLILYLDDDILEMALKVAGQKRNYNLQYIETVGLHLRQYLCRVNYEMVDGGVETKESHPREKSHLTLIPGGRTT
ncbi:MAG: hypothetical protein IBX64_11600 [Actinobacteria bacterium]|nr:hypothetical protein [Actinomycetota bacterium]